MTQATLQEIQGRLNQREIPWLAAQVSPNDPAVTIIGSRWIVGVQMRKAGEQQRVRLDAEREEARRADERSLRDGKRECLRGDYVAVAWAAESVDSAAMR